MTKAEKSRNFWNSFLLILAMCLPLFLLVAAGVVWGNDDAYTPNAALWIIILGLWTRRRKQLSVSPNSGAVTWSFDRPLVYCIIAGLLIGMVLSKTGVNSSTQLADPGDKVTPVTSTYSVFRVAVAESTGPSDADSSRRFHRFKSVVRLTFVTIGMASGLVVYLVGFRQRGRADSVTGAAETAGG